MDQKTDQTTPAKTGQATPDAAPNALQVLAELELLRRKAELLERRVAAWENELVEVRKAVHQLQKARDPAAPEWQQSVGELSHRVARLERRREAQAAEPAVSPVLPRGAGAGHTAVDLDAVALVRARWLPSEAERGQVVELLATSDGIAAGTPVTFTVRSLVHDLPVAEVVGACDGDQVAARWKVPADLEYGELVFEVRHGGTSARSPVLVLPVGG